MVLSGKSWWLKCILLSEKGIGWHYFCIFVQVVGLVSTGGFQQPGYSRPRGTMTPHQWELS